MTEHTSSPTHPPDGPPLIQGYTIEELLDWPREALETLDPQRLKETPDFSIAQLLERIGLDEARDLLRQLSVERVSDILSETDEESAAEILSAIRAQRATRILDNFDPDDAADIVAEMDDDHRERLMDSLADEDREVIESLLRYDPETAGGLMTTHPDLTLEDMTIDTAITEIRKIAGNHDDLHYVYVVDDENRLLGTVSLRKLIQAQPHQRLVDIMRSNIRGVARPEMDQEEVARLMAELNLLDIAVVDEENHLLGIITHDDILDVVQEEATEDILIMSGAGSDETVHDDVIYSVRKRQPWLFVNLCTAFVASFVVYLFQKEISALPILAALMPIIAGVGGNSGQQALAVAIRSLALGQIQKGEGRAVVFKQMTIGLINGTLIGCFAAAAVFLLSPGFEQRGLLSIVVLFAMVLNMLAAGLTGAFVPLFLNSIHRDPAQSSSILLTAITDTGGFFIFLGLGSWLLL